MAIFGRLSKYQDTGLLILRIGIGAMMIWHGYPKLIGGPEKWAQLGHSMSVFGMHDMPVFWGFMAAFAEAIGGLLFIVGFLFRPACLLLVINMVVASVVSYQNPAGRGMMAANHPIELAILFFAMFIIGPGRYSIDRN